MQLRFCLLLLLVYYVPFIAGNTCVSSNANLRSETSSKSDKIKWAIVALTKQSPTLTRNRDETLIRAIKPYAQKHDITVIYFSEIVFNPLDIVEWENTYKDVAKVRYINTAQHAFDLAKTGNKYGYKYMCKFFAMDIYQHLKEYDYYLRCDTDCKIKSLAYDLFEYVPKNQIEYGYALRKLEAHKPTKETLPVFTENYMKKCAITPSALMDQPLSTCFNFYNNFHIGKVSFFLRDDVQHYLHAVNETGRILSDRWGDSTIQAYAVRLFMDPSRIQYIPEFSYVHGSHNGFISTFPEGKKSNIPQMLPLWKYDGKNNQM
jgi:hypothetical protein